MDAVKMTVLYAEVILPLPLFGYFTYRVPNGMESRVGKGYRVIVPFGKKKYYTGIVSSLTDSAPQGVELKNIAAVLDEYPILRRPQLQLWEWMSDYYLCSVGEVYKAALPAGLKVESETFIEPDPDFDVDSYDGLSEREIIIMQVLDHAGKRLSVSDLERQTGFNNMNLLTARMLEKGAVMISEKLVERYRSRRVDYVRICADPDDQERVKELFKIVKRSKNQERALLALIELSAFNRRDSSLKEVALTDLSDRGNVSRAIIKAMADKGVLSIYKKEINRFSMALSGNSEPPVLSDAQFKALGQVHNSWKEHDITLLHGVTSSGKTEIYIHLIDFVLRGGRQVLYLVPEIALTTQLTDRLRHVFGDRVVIYHSKFSDNERVDIWKKMLFSSDPYVVIGARSSVFIPFSDLGLVIVDEEHEVSYKQQDPAPRYNARDTAMVLARMHGAKVLLGSATPAVDTYYKAMTGKYGLVTLSERFAGSVLPHIEIIDVGKARRMGAMHGIFAEQTLSIVRDAIKNSHQVILFLNRRGYAPVAVCRMCAWTPKCEHCDVTLTYHKYLDKLVCHYCGAVYPLPNVCPACKEPSIEVYGHGTERVEDDIESLLPDTEILRMDFDTTRNKDGYENIINEFSAGKAQVLVGTQMVTKGLDFGGVTAVAILNADSMMDQPDFRASERAFNMMEQVAGRAGRRDGAGIVAVQTRTPAHPLLSYVVNHDYSGFFSDELQQRRKYCYPPFTRLLYVYLKHRDYRELDDIAAAYARRLRELFGNRVFGPEEPMVGRVQTLYIRKVMLKIEIGASMKKVKSILRTVYEELMNSGMAAVRSAVVYYDVDPY